MKTDKTSHDKRKITSLHSFIFLVIVTGLIFYFQFAKAENIDEIDTDGDRLPDVKERELGTDPENRDSDGDGYSDGIEVRTGYDPLKPAPDDRLEDIDESLKNSVLLDVEKQSNTSEETVVSDKVSSSVSSSDTESQTLDLESLNLEELGSSLGEDSNLTDAFSQVMQYLSVYYQDSDGQLTLQQMDDVISEFLPESEVVMNLSVIDENELKLLDKTTKDDLQAYYTAFKKIYYDNLFIPYDKRENLTEDRGADYIEDYLKQMLNEDINNAVELQVMYGNIYDELKDVPVPDEILEEHKDYLSVMKLYEEIFSDIAEAENDPVKASTALQKYRQSFSMKNEFYQKEVEMSEKYNLVL